MFGHRTVALLITSGVCLLAGYAWAAEPTVTDSDSATSESAASIRIRAKVLYEEGLAAYRAGKYSDAVDKLLEADSVMPNAAFSYNIGLVYEAMGDERSALRWLRSYLRQSAPGTDQAACLSKVRKFEAHLQAKGMQQVSILSKPAGATVKIDGIALVGLTPFTTELAPGSHTVTLSLEGYEFAQRPFELRPDRSVDLDVPLIAVKSGPQEVIAPDPAPRQPSQVPLVQAAPMPPPSRAPVASEVRVKPWTWVTLGVGTAVLGSALGFELKRRGAEDDARAASQDSYSGHYDRMQSAQYTARVLATAGSGLLVLGLGLLTFDLTRSGAPRTASVGSCPSGGFCAALGGQF